MNTRDYMKNHGENLGWCKPYKVEDKEIYWASNNGRVCSVKIGDDEFINVGDDVLRKLAGAVDPGCGPNDRHSINDHLYHSGTNYRELPCSECPWFDACDAMDGEL